MGTLMPTSQQYGNNQGTTLPATQQHWIEYEHKDFVLNKPKWVVATDVYSGEIMNPTKLPRYLVQRSSGEHTKAFEERMRLADYTNHFATVVDGLAGMMFAVEEEATRVTVDDEGNGLGDYTDPTTLMGQLWQHANDEGQGWLMVFKQLLLSLCVRHNEWILTYGSGDAPMVKLISALSVPNWIVKNGRMTQVLVEEEVDARDDLEQNPNLRVRQFMRYKFDGFQRYLLEKRADQPGWQGNLRVLDAAGGGEEGVDFGRYSFVDPRGMPALPIFRVALPMARDVGYLWARKALAIFNQESMRDALVRNANSPKLTLGGSREEFEQNRDDLADGQNLLHNSNEQKHPHAYIAPDVAPAKVATEVLERKVSEFFNTAHQAYGDSARQRTATEARQDVAKGAGAFLALTRQTIDDAEAAAAWRIAQIAHPSQKQHWYAFSVTRSTDFMPADPDVGVERVMKRMLGADRSIPAGATGKIAAAQQIVGWQGITASDDEIAADVKCRELLDLIDTEAVPVPPVIQQYALALKLVAIGKMKLDAAEALFTEAAVKPALDEMLQLAMNAAEANARQAEALPTLHANKPPGKSALEPGDASNDPGSRADGSSQLIPRALLNT